MDDLQEKVVFNLAEASEYLGVSVNTMYQILESNTLNYRRIGKRYLVARMELDAWLRDKPKRIGKGSKKKKNGKY